MSLFRLSKIQLVHFRCFPDLLGLEDAVIATLGGGDVTGFSYAVQRGETPSS
jgi:hypothetical protein